jgi:hypothetical protein
MADSPSLRSSEGSASQSTRQLLDELDALMQRMLAVPVEKGDSPEAAEAAPRPAEPAVKVEVPLPPQFINSTPAPRTVELLPTPIVVQAPAPRPPVGGFAATVAEPEAAAPTYIPVGAEPLLPLIVQRPPSLVAEIPPLPRVQPPAPVRKVTVEPAPPARPAWMNPTAVKPPAAPVRIGNVTQLLVMINRSYDRGTALLGGPGRWLRSQQGRAMLGWTGLAMLITALVWAALRFLD